MEAQELLKVFTYFLKRENAYESFCRELKYTHKMPIEEFVSMNKSMPDKLVMRAFSWGGEGYAFWCEIHDKWQKECRNILK